MTAARRAKSRGISTAETLAAAALSLMGLATVYSFFHGQQRALATQGAYAQSQTVTRTVIDLLSRELRMASYDPTGAALPTSPGPNCSGVKQGIIEATRTRLRIQQDLDGDGLLASAAEDVTYQVVEDRLQRTDRDGVPVTLADDIPLGGLSFRYFNGSNPPVELHPTGEAAALTPGQRDCVTKVRLRVRASVPAPDPRHPAPLTSEAESEVAIRNRSLANF